MPPLLKGLRLSPISFTHQFSKMASLSPLSGVLGRRRAAHLLRRTSYRFTKTKVDELTALTAAQALPLLLQLYPIQVEQPHYDDPTTPDLNENLTWCLPYGTTPPIGDFKLRRPTVSWWINEAVHDPGIGHKMSFFFHQYLITDILSYGTAHFFDYLALLRWGALGNFKKLATKMVTDNCMLRYLNNTQNSKNSPNENFAREFFELFTIGKGPQIGPGDYTNYTEDDIVQAARVFTGFRVQGGRNMFDAETGLPHGVPRINNHDKEDKTFSANFQNTVIIGADTEPDMLLELDALVNMVFAQPETAKNLCRRLYRFFVSRNLTAEIESDIIVPLANTLIASNFEVKPVLEQLLQSQHFFDADDSDNTDEIIGGMIKAPLELALQAITFFNLPIPDPITNTVAHYGSFYGNGVQDRMFGLANLQLFYPDNVAGYPAYYQTPDYHHQWFNSSTIIARYKLPAMLLSGKYTIGGQTNRLFGSRLDIAPWIKNSGNITDPTDPYVLVNDLLDYLLPEPPAPERFDYFFLDVFLTNLPPADWTYDWQDYLNTNNDENVKIPLERLINNIMFSPEFQTF